MCNLSGNYSHTIRTCICNLGNHSPTPFRYVIFIHSILSIGNSEAWAIHIEKFIIIYLPFIIIPLPLPYSSYALE